MEKEHIVKVYYSKINQILPMKRYRDYLNMLPLKMIEKNKRYVRWQDKHAHLYGKLLLLEGLKSYNLQHDILRKVKYNSYNRPYLPGKIDFNISHSGKYVVCALGVNVRLGIDIEEIKPIDFNDLKSVMTNDQWLKILDNNKPFECFFNYWTMKESVIKADSRGLSLPIQGLDKIDNTVIVEDKIWHLSPLKIDSNYSTYLAVNTPMISIEFNNLKF
ncbi:MAG: 4'-phosphopantetheinyl transferase superfamily protein [Fulvivirga sp.]|uniref:4'-phosphopantetheinyl transferase family protein n=1 Tax=Fulvivirga sp. TaxID=1931237 RepID=UPI0032EF2998